MFFVLKVIMKVRNNYGMSETIRETRYECVERGKRGTLKKEKEKEKEKEREREKKKKEDSHTK